MKLLLALLTLAFFNFPAYSQQNNLDNSKRYIKIIIDSEVSQQQQEEITAALSQLKGIETSRMDNTTGLFLGVYSPNNNLSEHTFLNWFANHGYTVTCYYDAVYTIGGMIELTKRTCR